MLEKSVCPLPIKKKKNKDHVITITQLKTIIHDNIALGSCIDNDLDVNHRIKMPAFLFVIEFMKSSVFTENFFRTS